MSIAGIILIIIGVGFIFADFTRQVPTSNTSKPEDRELKLVRNPLGLFIKQYVERPGWITIQAVRDEDEEEAKAKVEKENAFFGSKPEEIITAKEK